MPARTSAQIVVVLNRLLRTLCRSLPCYLQDARPWRRPEDQAIWEAILRLADDQAHYAARLGQLLDGYSAPLSPGRFPMEFSSYNDISAEFLLTKVIERQRDELHVLRRCVDDLAEVPVLRDLAEEILGNAQGHLELLGQVAAGEKA